MEVNSHANTAQSKRERVAMCSDMKRAPAFCMALSDCMEVNKLTIRQFRNELQGNAVKSAPGMFFTRQLSRKYSYLFRMSSGQSVRRCSARLHRPGRSLREGGRRTDYSHEEAGQDNRNNSIKSETARWWHTRRLLISPGRAALAGSTFAGSLPCAQLQVAARRQIGGGCG